MKKYQKALIAVTLISLALAPVIYWAFYQRDYMKYDYKIETKEGEFAIVKQVSSSLKWHGIHPHIGWGGDGSRHEFEIKLRENTFKWETPHKPIVLNFYKDGFYAVVIDVTLGSPVKFRYYFIYDGVREIRPYEFPKSIAIQNVSYQDMPNIYYTEPYDEMENAKIMDVTDPVFRQSYTARIWFHLEQGIDYDSGLQMESSSRIQLLLEEEYDYESYNNIRGISSEFLKDYKQRYIPTE